jgi:hypothetical protein
MMTHKVNEIIPDRSTRKGKEMKEKENMKSMKRNRFENWEFSCLASESARPKSVPTVAVTT